MGEKMKCFFELQNSVLGDFKRSEAQLDLIKDSCSFENQHPCYIRRQN